MNIRENVPISELTTMRLGGNARYVVDIATAEDIPVAFKFAREKNLPSFVMGAGSNTIGHDEGYNGVILLNLISGIKIISQDGLKTTVESASGEELDDLVGFTTERGLTGIEAMSAIPGTVGGAVIQNSGAYGQDLSQVLVSVSAYDSKTDTFVDFNSNELDLAYRQSIFNTSAQGRYFITSIQVELHPGEIAGDLYQSLQKYLDEHNINDRKPSTIRSAVTAIRANKLPDPKIIASSGSFFHNVTIDDEKLAELRAKYPDMPSYLIGNDRVVPAAWLIEQCGLKGKIFHGMRVNPAAPLVLINESAQQYSDLDAARCDIRDAIRQKFGLELEQEPEEI